jgi:uncharacterized membrane protein YdbT with pleckstrin-like domain
MAINLEKDEYVIFEVRKHWFTLILPGLFIIAAALIPVFVYSFFSILPIQLESDYNLTILFLFLYVNWIIVLWTISFFIWTDYFLDVWIITNKNLIDVEQIGVFHREISTTRLSRIQDVNSEVKGLFPTFLNFGNLSIQTAGSNTEFKIVGIDNPIQVRENLEKAISQYNQTIAHASL